MVNEILQGADPAALDIEGKPGPENGAGDNVEHLKKSDAKDVSSESKSATGSDTREWIRQPASRQIRERSVEPSYRRRLSRSPRYYEERRQEDYFMEREERAQQNLEVIVNRSAASNMTNIDPRSRNVIDVYYRDLAVTDRPWLIVINSWVLIDHLAAIPGWTRLRMPLVIASPFKILMSNLSQLSTQSQESSEIPKGDLNKMPVADNKEIVPITATSPNNILHKSKEERRGVNEHFRCLDEVVKVDLNSLLALKAQIADGSLKKIAFTDLWHLFTPGELAISKRDGHEQLYKIFHVKHRPPWAGDRRIVRRRERERVVYYERDMPKNNRRRDFSSEEESEDEASDEEDYYPFFVRGIYMNFDGTSVGPTSHVMAIRYFSMEKDITDLDIYPLKFHNPSDDILGRLIGRGKRFLSCQGHMSYDGMTARRYGSRKDLVELQGEIYVDFKTGYRDIGARHKPLITKSALETLVPMEPEIVEERDVYDERNQYSVHPRRPMPRVQEDQMFERQLALQVLDDQSSTLRTISPEEAEMLPEYLQLLPHQVLAYVFRSRKWHFVDVDFVEDIDKSDSVRDSGFDDLVIPKHYRDLLVALVQSHTSENTQKGKLQSKMPSTQMDLVHGKGRGLIILLHGPPGVGKTSTAETIAAYTKRPLYSITCGDIGLTALEIERNMSEHFRLANKWGCVLLLDEADVFLMKRDWRDINRNALVSVFLRVLEYYSGILFLTTNRIGVIDEAFKSRVHICLRYPSIDLQSTRSIWENLLDRITRDNEKQQIKIVFDKEDLLSFAERHYKRNEKMATTWNGRQIRNAFQTAVALGQHDRTNMLRAEGLTEEQAEKRGKAKYLRVRLTQKNFQKIAKTAKDFEDYMVNVRGSDIHAAQEESLRDDDFDPSNVRARKQYGDLLSVSPGRSRFGASPSPGLRRGGAASTTATATMRRTREIPDEDEGEDEDEFGGVNDDDDDDDDDNGEDDN